ncbi:MAG: C40 family peptidase [Bacteroidaceae bacterium]|nr:C40 family peptidase [Bacteroidaceae bacterium]
MKRLRKKHKYNSNALFLRWKGWGALSCLTLVLFLSSCHSSRPLYRDVDMRELARAGLALGFDIEEYDNWKLMIESSKWLGVPYKYAGNTKSGVDCSGFTSAIYKTVYNKQLHRRSVDQYTQDCRHANRTALSSGDLVFFATSGSKTTENINHVGIYLKNNKFIHASSSRGVVVDDLSSKYFVQNWVAGGKVK